MKILNELITNSDLLAHKCLQLVFNTQKLLENRYESSSANGTNELTRKLKELVLSTGNSSSSSSGVKGQSGEEHADSRFKGLMHCYLRMAKFAAKGRQDACDNDADAMSQQQQHQQQQQQATHTNAQLKVSLKFYEYLLNLIKVSSGGEQAVGMLLSAVR